jgi:2-methylaconitate cis-trans-isomerase PrpF
MRGGTSTGLVLHAASVPPDPALREELLRHLMGVPQSGELPGNRQVTDWDGARPPATRSSWPRWSSMRASRASSAPAQLASGHAAIDWSVNCGNMSSALQLWGLDSGVIEALAIGTHAVDIRNTNTGVLSTSRMERAPDGSFAAAAIPGVPGSFPAWTCSCTPVGTKTGHLLPTGNAQDQVLATTSPAWTWPCPWSSPAPASSARRRRRLCRRWKRTPPSCGRYASCGARRDC